MADPDTTPEVYDPVRAAVAKRDPHQRWVESLLEAAAAGDAAKYDEAVSSEGAGADDAGEEDATDLEDGSADKSSPASRSVGSIDQGTRGKAVAVRPRQSPADYVRAIIASGRKYKNDDS